MSTKELTQAEAEAKAKAEAEAKAKAEAEAETEEAKQKEINKVLRKADLSNIKQKANGWINGDGKTYPSVYEAYQAQKKK